LRDREHYQARADREDRGAAVVGEDELARMLTVEEQQQHEQRRRVDGGAEGERQSLGKRAHARDSPVAEESWLER
jgi:hypothetical protein